MQGSLKIKEVDLLNHIQHGVIVIDVEGTILYLNSASEKIFGYTLEELTGKSMKLLCDEDESSTFEQLVETCRREEKYSGKWHIKCKKNTLIWVDIKSSKFVNEVDGKPYCIITITNIEPLENIKKDLKKAVALENTILETSADAIITADGEGKILSFNRAAVQMFGYSKNETIGRDVQTLIPSFYTKNQEFFSSRFKNNTEAITYGGDIDMQALRKDGTVFHTSTSVSNIPWNGDRMFVSIIRDLTHKRELEKRMINITNEERQRIGRELHDGLGQMLTGIRMVAESLARKLKANEIPGAGEVQEIAEMVKEADERARALSRGLVEVHLIEKGLSSALESLATRITKTFGIDCFYTEDGRIEFDNHTVALHVYRIVQEAVTNAVRHGDAETIHIHLSKNGKGTNITIEDDGSGFAPKDVTDSGSGIQIMKYRADILGGVLDICRTEDEKTLVRCIIPDIIENLNDETELKE